MSILEVQFCRDCQEKTYHRYHCSLRDEFIATDCWECIACTERKQERTRVEYAPPPTAFKRQLEPEKA